MIDVIAHHNVMSQLTKKKKEETGVDFHLDLLCRTVRGDLGRSGDLWREMRPRELHVHHCRSSGALLCLFFSSFPPSGESHP